MAVLKTTSPSVSLGAPRAVPSNTVPSAKANTARYHQLGWGWSTPTPFTLPFRRTEYVNVDGNAQWESSFQQQVAGEPLTFTTAEPATFHGGRTYHQQWNKAVFAPSVAGARTDADYLTRTGDVISGGIPTFGEGPGHPGYSDAAVTMSLYRGDTRVGSVDTIWGEFEVPAETADYRIELSATRGAPHTLSTRALNTWTFRSGHVAGDQPHRLALSTIRFDPVLDPANRATAGRLFTVPVRLDHQLATSTTRLSSVEASFDDGETWKSVPVKGSDAVVRHPGRAGFVSLRAHATDRAGNKVDQTVIRAYAIG